LVALRFACNNTVASARVGQAVNKYDVVMSSAVKFSLTINTEVQEDEQTGNCKKEPNPFGQNVCCGMTTFLNAGIKKCRNQIFSLSTLGEMLDGTLHAIPRSRPCAISLRARTTRATANSWFSGMKQSARLRLRRINAILGYTSTEGAGKSQVAFAATSVCDRIAFARRVVKTGLPVSPPEKKTAKLACRDPYDTFSGPV
jgi:hypothetical protein